MVLGQSPSPVVTIARGRSATRAGRSASVPSRAREGHRPGQRRRGRRHGDARPRGRRAAGGPPCRARGGRATAAPDEPAQRAEGEREGQQEGQRRHLGALRAAEQRPPRRAELDEPDRVGRIDARARGVQRADARGHRGEVVARAGDGGVGEGLGLRKRRRLRVDVDDRALGRRQDLQLVGPRREPELARPDLATRLAQRPGDGDRDRRVGGDLVGRDVCPARDVVEHGPGRHQMRHQIGARGHPVEIRGVDAAIGDPRAAQIDHDVRDDPGGLEVAALELRGQQADPADRRDRAQERDEQRARDDPQAGGHTCGWRAGKRHETWRGRAPSGHQRPARRRTCSRKIARAAAVSW